MSFNKTQCSFRVRMTKEEYDDFTKFAKYLADTPGLDYPIDTRFEGWSWEFEKESTSTGTSMIHIWSDKYCGKDDMGTLWQKWLTKNNRNDIVAFEWSYTSNEKGFYDQFGGGVIVVTKDSYNEMDTKEWMEQTIKTIIKLREAQKC